MSKKKLFDEDLDEEEVSFKTENEYAKKYDNWREKEELHKLEQKYGNKALNSDASLSSDSEEDEDEPLEVSEETEAQFLKTLALLKTKDPRIYDPQFKFFDKKEEKKEETRSASKTLTFEDSDDSDSGDDGTIFKVEKKAEIAPEPVKKKDEKVSKEAKIKDFLTGKAEHIDDEVEQDLAPLKALWSDPKLNEGEAFLRDYILNKRYLEEGDVGDAEDRLRDDEDLEEDERRVEEQGKFERAYNFRFEEPDDEYLKRYPRTMNYTRPKDDRRSKKRAEVRARKEEEKRKKMEEIARLKSLKLKEIQEKIAKIKEVTGNKDLAFKEDDIEGDFDPEEHDRRMKALFDEEFYGEADDEKPVFPDLDEELEIENWDKYEPDQDRHKQGTLQDDDEPHCEDDDFNMDADYDPKQAKAKLIEEIQSTLGKKRRNRKKKSKLAELLASEKPKFVPTVADKTYNDYMEEYYKMDCEDVIGGDLPTRFKYREVVPNDYGLTIEEILLADDKELTQWVPLKKIVKHRSQDVEKSEVKTYRLKAADKKLKKKVLPSLFKDLPQDPEIVVPIEEATKKKKKKNKIKEKKTVEETEVDQEEQMVTDNTEQNSEVDNADTKSKKKKKKHKDNIENTSELHIEESIETNQKKYKKKHKNTEVNQEIIDNHNEVTKPNKLKESESKEFNIEELSEASSKKHKKKHKQNENIETNIEEDFEPKNKKNHKTAEESVPKDIQHSQDNAGKINNSNKVDSQVTVTSKNKKKKKKRIAEGFVIESVQKQEPSHNGQEGNRQNNLKRKSNQNQSDQVPNKKHKKQDLTKNKSKDKFKQNKNKRGKDQSSDNPLNKLSDERLKAYGLNPKKYRSFLKYKKF